MVPPRRPARATAHVRPFSLPAWGAACFFASGAAALLYEVVWSKQLAYLLGNSLHSVATVVAAFLAGLAIGARVLGVPMARRGNGARKYAVLEIGVAVLGLAILPVLRGLEPAIGEMYRALGGEGLPFALARFGLLFAVLLPPAALMGATLPVLVAHFERDLIGPALARLYALNTFGAVAGSIAGGFLLLPNLGLTATTGIAAALNLGVAALAWARSGVAASTAEAPPAPAPAPAPASASPEAARTSAPRAAAAHAGLIGGSHAAFAVLFALSGFGALVFQIAWVRLFGLVFGSSVYSFSAVLGVYLLGLAFGSMLIGNRLRREVGVALYGRLQLVLAAIAALMLHVFSRLPQWTYDLAERSGTNWGALFTSQVLVTAMLLLAPCAILGAAFPLAARLLQRGGSGQAAGFAYAVNTAGTIAGSLVAGFVLVPNWGPQGAHLFAAMLATVIGLACMAIAAPRRELGRFDGMFAGLALAAIALFAGTAPRWDPALMSQGAFRPVQASMLETLAGGDGHDVVWKASRSERILYYREGINGSVLVGTDAQGERWLRVGGKVDASTADMETQVLLGLLPAASADSGARTLVVGHGSGFTLAAALAAGAGRTDVVEIEAGVIEGSRWFHEGGQDPLDDPRTNLIIGDARTHLTHSREIYDLVISEPSNPWIAGVNNLFTVDFYRRVRARLAPDGVFCQWMQLYELTPETWRSMVASFLEVFPEGHVFAIWESVDVLLIAMPEGRRIDLARLEQPAARAMLERARIRNPSSIAAYYGGPLERLREFAAGATLNRDDRPIVEYRAPRDLVAVGRSSPDADPAVLQKVPFAEAPPPGALFADWQGSEWYESRVNRLVAVGQFARATSVADGLAASGNPAEAERMRALVGTGQRRRQAHIEAETASMHMRAGRMMEARAALERAGNLDPSNSRLWFQIGYHRALNGEHDRAAEAIARGRANTDDPGVLSEGAMVAGMLEMERNRPQQAAMEFREAQRLSPGMARGYAMEAMALETLRDLDGARAAIARGLAAAPGEQTLVAEQARLSRAR